MSDTRCPLEHLADYRRMREQRDGWIRAAAAQGHRRSEIAKAAGLSVDRIKQILGDR